MPGAGADAGEPLVERRRPAVGRSQRLRRSDRPPGPDASAPRRRPRLRRLADGRDSLGPPRRSAASSLRRLPCGPRPGRRRRCHGDQDVAVAAAGQIMVAWVSGVRSGAAPVSMDRRPVGPAARPAAPAAGARPRARSVTSIRRAVRSGGRHGARALGCSCSCPASGRSVGRHSTSTTRRASPCTTSRAIRSHDLGPSVAVGSRCLTHLPGAGAPVLGARLDQAAGRVESRRDVAVGGRREHDVLDAALGQRSRRPRASGATRGCAPWP